MSKENQPSILERSAVRVARFVRRGFRACPGEMLDDYARLTNPLHRIDYDLGRVPSKNLRPRFPDNALRS